MIKRDRVSKPNQTEGHQRFSSKTHVSTGGDNGPKIYFRMDTGEYVLPLRNSIEYGEHPIRFRGILPEQYNLGHSFRTTLLNDDGTIKEVLILTILDIIHELSASNHLGPRTWVIIQRLP